MADRVRRLNISHDSKENHNKTKEKSVGIFYEKYCKYNKPQDLFLITDLINIIWLQQVTKIQQNMRHLLWYLTFI